MDQIDPLWKARRICEAHGRICRRTLYTWVRSGKFPPPDRPARRRGEADLWRESTVKRALEDYTRGGQAA